MIKTERFTSVPQIRHTEAAIKTNSVDFEKVVRSRRSVRVFSEEKIPTSVMRKCLELALLAPNSSNLQPWEFYWVRSESNKKELARLCLGQPAATTARELIVCVARIDTWKRNRRMMIEMLADSATPFPEVVTAYYEQIVPLAYGQGPFNLLGPVKKLILKVAALTKPLPRGPAGKADMRVWAHKSTALACENLMLALRAFGFDSCPIEGMDEVRIRQLLQLPRGAEVCMVIAAGKRAVNGIYRRRFASTSRCSFLSCRATKPKASMPRIHQRMSSGRLPQLQVS